MGGGSFIPATTIPYVILGLLEHDYAERNLSHQEEDGSYCIGKTYVYYQILALYFVDDSWSWGT